MANWQKRELDESGEGRFEALKGAGCSPLLARLLALRGIGPEGLEAYLAPSLGNLVRPAELPGAEEAADVILRSIRNRDWIVVFGDYDCDGVSATAIMLTAINAVAGMELAHPFIPERLTEGYGMNDSSVRRMLKSNPEVKLVVTVDNGINSVEQVDELRLLGVKVVVTDHHLPGDRLPRGQVVVDPKVKATAATQDLCGAGVAFMLAGALVARAKQLGMYSGPNVGGPLLVLAGLATVTDIMPLVGQNRILVSEALRRFRKLAPIGLRELYDHAATRATAELNSKDFGFVLGPRINAAGRMASSMEALALVLAQDRETARRLAVQIDTRNYERKSIESEMSAQALEQVVEGAPAQVIHLPDGHQGVAGIVASRILERCPTGPVAVIVGEHGSCRAPSGFNVRDALLASSEVLTRFGGHAQAGGFSVADGRIEDFRRLFTAAAAAQAAALTAQGSAPDIVWYDTDVTGTEFTVEEVEGLQKLEPYGEGNEEPVFCLRGVYLSEVRTLGMEARHLLLGFRIKNCPRAVWWGHGDDVEKYRAASREPHDVLFRVDISDYGTRHVEFRIVAID